MTDHYMPGGSRVIGYVAQLELTGHKFGSHVLTNECHCRPTVRMGDGTSTTHGRTEVWHQPYTRPSFG